jgi:hypothetical protein
MFAKPTNGTAVLKINATIHAPEFEEWKKGAIGNGGANLGTPACITVCRDGGRILRFFGRSICVSFYIQ